MEVFLTSIHFPGSRREVLGSGHFPAKSTSQTTSREVLISHHTVIFGQKIHFPAIDFPGSRFVRYGGSLTLPGPRLYPLTGIYRRAYIAPPISQGIRFDFFEDKKTEV